jgi:hypothetical protein
MHEEQTPLLTIVVRWGADVLHVVHRSPPESFLVGESARPPFGYAVPAALLGVERASLVRVDESRREVWLVVLPRAVGKIEEEGKPSVSLRSWIDAGRAERHDGVRGAYELRMPLGSRAIVELGALVFEVAFGGETWPAEEAVAAPPLSGMATRKITSFAIAVALHAGVLVGSAFAMPSLDEVEEPAPSSAYVLQPVAAYGDGPESARPEEDIEEKLSLDGDERELAPQSQCSRDDGGSMGKPTAADDSHRYGVQGPSDNPDPHLARLPSTLVALDFGHGNEDVQWGGDPRAPMVPWGRDDTLGNDAESAMGNMWGDVIKASFGSPGAGVGERKLCPTCGGEGRGPRLVLPTSGGGATGTEPASLTMGGDPPNPPPRAPVRAAPRTFASVTAGEGPSARRR